MALTIGNSPLAPSPGGKFNFEIERLPRHLLYLEDFQKRIRGQLAGRPSSTPAAANCYMRPASFPSGTCPRRMSSRGHWGRASVARSILSEEWPTITTSARGTGVY